MTGQRFHNLDGLRGVCALSVVLFHCSGLFRQGPIFQHGFLAVDMFFLLSGFVIALAHEARLKAGETLPAFLGARARRLLPVYWLGAIFNIAIFIWMARAGYYPGYGWATVWLLVPLLTLLLLPAFGTPGAAFSQPMMNVSWSLAVEWAVNTFYATGLFRLRTRTLLLLVAAGWGAMAVAGYHTGRGWCVGIDRYEVFTYGLLRGAPAFLAGVVIQRLQARGRFARLPVVAPEISLMLWLCIAAVPTAAATPSFDAIAVILLCPALIIALIRAEHRAPVFCRALGGLSYPLYTVHPGIILLAQATPLFGLNHAPNPARALLVVAICLGAAWVLQSISNMPPMRLGRPSKLAA